ncbi:MAG: trypsin-like serine protease [Myxococcota bacterium]
MSTLPAMFVASLFVSVVVTPTAPGAAAAASPSLAAPSEPFRIVGGTETEEGEFDAVAAIEIDGFGQCTGTLIDPWLVLTAAHCFDASRDDQSVHVYFGANGTSIAASGYGIHPNYCTSCAEQFGSDYGERYDFAYVVLSERYDPADGLLLPVTSQQEWNDTMQIGSTVRLVGYGQTQPLGGSSSPGRSKHEVTTIIEKLSPYGLEFYAGQDEVTRDTCNGDSGGPVIVRTREGQLRLAGVTSRGSDPCGDGGWYGVAFAALPWIDHHTHTELLPVGCELGDCLDLVPPDDSASRCSVGNHPDDTAWLKLGLGLLLGLRRRRPSRVR